MHPVGEQHNPHHPITREATGRLLQRVVWRSRDRRMLDERWSFPQVGTELLGEAEGKDPREETSAVPAHWASRPQQPARSRRPLPSPQRPIMSLMSGFGPVRFGLVFQSKTALLPS